MDLLAQGRRFRAAVCLSHCLLASQANAQPSPSPPAPSPKPTPDDTPSIRLGTVVYANYTYTGSPASTDADGNTIHFSQFEISRVYLNVTGDLHHRLSFRVTPDIAGRLATSVSGGSSGETASTNYDGNLVFRLKFAYAQVKLDDWLPSGSWVRFGQQDTPFVIFMEGIYRYRFQGNIFEEREGYLTSSDVGVSGRLAFPGNYGDAHVGIYNGDGYAKTEANDRKALQMRATLRPAPKAPLWAGLRVSGFYDADSYIKNGARHRFISSVTFEHKRLNLGADYLQAADQVSARARRIESAGYTLWIQPRTRSGVEGFLRYDSLKPNTSVEARKKRTLAGLSYWMKSRGSAQAAAFLNFERVGYDRLLARPTEKRLALSCLFSF